MTTDPAPLPALPELKPCPFCGNKPWGIFGPHTDLGSCWVECHSASGEPCGDWHFCGTREETAEAWNRRAAQTAPDAKADPDTDWPIARLTIADDDSVTATMYAPSLPPGQHDVWCVPVAVPDTPDWLFRSKTADLLHLLQFASISTASSSDDVQAQKVMADLKRMLAAAPVAQTAPDAALLTAVRLVLDCHQEQLPMALDALRDIAGDAPVAQQAAPMAALLVRDLAADVGVEPLALCKTLESLGYGPHSVNMAVTADMAREVTRLYAAAHAQQPAPLTDAQIKAEADRLYAADQDFFTVDQWFERGVRFAERAHGIPAPTTDTGEGA